MKVFALFFVLTTTLVFAQTKPPVTSDTTSSSDTEKAMNLGDVQKYVSDLMATKWYEKINVRGYTNFRYNRLLETNNKLTCATCDSSVGDKQGFFFRRTRLTFFGDVTDKVYFYIQPDFATTATGPANGNGAINQQNFVQLRDAYFDYYLSEDKNFRLRTGLQKVIFGYENLTSSSNRLAFDRSDAINSAAPNERDMGLTLMYTPEEIRKRFKAMQNTQYKGTGDYGLVSVAVYNGQSMNRSEANNDLHRAMRVTYPFKLSSGQLIETSLHAYAGKYNTKDQGLNKNFYDGREGFAVHYFPQPFGFQAEWNVGVGPEYDRRQNKIRSKNLKGGYALVNYTLMYNNHRFLPYVRYQEYKGGYKLMPKATLGRMHEVEIGTEWQPNGAFELQVAYGMQDRIYQSSPTNRTHQLGNLLRLQAQFMY
jgi:hypothetical protein